MTQPEKVEQDLVGNSVGAATMNTSEARKIRPSAPASQSASSMLNVEGKLQSALENLKQTMNMGYELGVKWVPNIAGKLSGEVKGNYIYVYEENEREALETLRHEFVDYAISTILEPYQQVTNKLIALINEEAYKRKERLVEKLSSLLPEF